MKTYTIELETPMICYCVRSLKFPDDAKACHEKLHSKVKFDPERNYLGLSKFRDDGSLEYLAACTSLEEGELEGLGFEKIEIRHSRYLGSDLENFMNRIDQIGIIFEELCRDPHFIKDEWAIERYIKDVCQCMIPVK